MGVFGYGKHALAVTFIYPSLYNRVKKHTKPATQLQLSDTLIITICLLLSGDIHPCPGPLHTIPGNEANITVDETWITTVSQDTAGSVLPTRSGVAGAAADEPPQAFQTSADGCLQAKLRLALGGLVPALVLAGVTAGSNKKY